MMGEVVGAAVVAVAVVAVTKGAGGGRIESSAVKTNIFVPPPDTQTPQNTDCTP